MAKLLSKELSMKQIELIIKERIVGKELWGDIDLSIEEYEILRDSIKNEIHARGFTVLQIAKAYPLSLTTMMVFLVRYKYDYNFWGLMSEELSEKISTNQTSDLGACARVTFSSNGFDYSEVANERRKYIEPIIFEAGLPPESSLDDLFYVLRYDEHAVFDPHLIIEDLLERRSYQIRKPMERFIKRFKENRAVEFIVDVHDAMLCVDQHMTGTSCYIENYSNWKEREQDRETVKTRKQQEYQTKPYLCFDTGKKGLCLVLPRAIMKNEWSERVIWHITMEDEPEITKEMNVLGDEGRRYIDTIIVPVCPSASYVISLTDAEDFEESFMLSWTISGVKEDGALFFNANGRMVNANHLTYPFGIMVFGAEAGISQIYHTDVIDQAYPTNRPQYRIAMVEPEGSKSYISYFHDGTETTLRTKPQIRTSFIGSTLFALPVESGCSIFTRIPNMQISVDEGADISEIELRIEDNRYQISPLIENNTATINLESLCGELFLRHGTYSVKVYQHDHFVKLVEFSYVPDIWTNYSSDITWPETKDDHENKVFLFAKKSKYSLEFENCVVMTNEDYYTVECPGDIGSIRVTIQSTTEDEKFFGCVILPIRPFTCEITDATGMDYKQGLTGVLKLGIDDIQENEYWATFETFGEYADLTYALVLRTANGIEQIEQMKQFRNGCANFCLSAFYDTLENSLLPARIELCCANEFEKAIPIVLINDNVSLKAQPQYISKGFIVLSLEDKDKNLTVRKFGSKGNVLYFPATEAKLGKSGKSIGYKCESSLDEGLYVIECSKSESIIDFEDDFETALSNSNVLYVSSRTKDTPVDSFSAWLDEIIKRIGRAGNTHDFKPDFSSMHRLKAKEIESRDYEKLISLAYFVADEKCLRRKTETILQCMHVISVEVLDSLSRIELIRTLAEINCPKTVFDICLVNYNLYMFAKDTPDAKTLAEKIEISSPELSLLLRMGCDEAIRNTIWREKYGEIVGKEALRSLLNVPDVYDKAIKAEEIRKFVREQKGSKVRINLTKEIAGDMQPIQEMIVYPAISTQAARLDTTKKPEGGIYFDHIRYIDQYINWYRLNHDRNGNMLDNTRDKMISAVKENAELIKSGVRFVKKNIVLGDMVARYEQAVKARYDKDPAQNLSSPIPHRFFYLQAMAALLVMLPHVYRQPNWNVTAAEKFLTEALTIAPKISRRDIMMASTFVYLVRKEIRICQ